MEGNRSKNFNFNIPYNLHHVLIMKRIATSFQIQIKCIGIELTYLVAFVLVADEGAEKYGERQFDMCFCPSSEYVCSTFFRPIMSQQCMKTSFIYHTAIELFLAVFQTYISRGI